MKTDYLNCPSCHSVETLVKTKFDDGSFLYRCLICDSLIEDKEYVDGYWQGYNDYFFKNFVWNKPKDFIPIDGYV